MSKVTKDEQHISTYHAFPWCLRVTRTGLSGYVISAELSKNESDPLIMDCVGLEALMSIMKTLPSLDPAVEERIGG